MCKGPVARGTVSQGVQHGQNMGCRGAGGWGWRGDESEGPPGPECESSEASVVQTAGLNGSVAHEVR